MAAESVGHGSRPMGHGAQVHGAQGTWQLGIGRGLPLPGAASLDTSAMAFDRCPLALP